MSFRSHSASAAPSLSRRPHLHFLPLSPCCSLLISLSCAFHSSLSLLSARLNRDQFISQITSGHRRQLQALRSISYSPPPLPPSPRLSPPMYTLSFPRFCFLPLHTQSSLCHLPPTPPPPPRLYTLVNPPRGWGWKGGMRTGGGRFSSFFLVVARVCAMQREPTPLGLLNASNQRVQAP